MVFHRSIVNWSWEELLFSVHVCSAICDSLYGVIFLLRRQFFAIVYAVLDVTLVHVHSAICESSTCGVMVIH